MLILLVFAITIFLCVCVGRSQAKRNIDGVGAAIAYVFIIMVSIVLIIYLIERDGQRRLPPPQEIPPLERFLSGEEVELRDILHNLQNSATLPSLIKLWATKNFPDRNPDEACRAIIGEIYRIKVKMVLPASIAEDVTVKFTEESVPSASTPAPDMAPTPAPTPTPAE